MGLLILESSDAVDGIEEGDIIEIDPDNGKIKNTRTGIEYKSQKIPPFMQQLVSAGGLMEYLKKRIKEEQ